MFAALLRVTAGVTPTVPRLAYSLVALDAAQAGVGAGPGAGAAPGLARALVEVVIPPV